MIETDNIDLGLPFCSQAFLKFSRSLIVIHLAVRIVQKRAECAFRIVG